MPGVTRRRPQRAPPIGMVQPNRLLRALSAADYAALLPDLRRVAISSGQPISEPLERSRQGYFPETAVFSLIIVMADGAAV